MNDAEFLDGLFRQAVAAIDSGDAVTLERFLAEHPRLVCERLEAPGEWLRKQIGPAVDGFFRHPYLLWFVTEDAVRTGQLSVNVAEVARVIIQAARRAGVTDLQHQLDSTLHFAVCSPIGREDGRQRGLLDVLIPLHHAVWSGSLDAVRVLVEAGANLTTKDRAEDATPLGWAEYAETLPEAATRGKQHTEIAAYLREKGARV